MSPPAILVKIRHCLSPYIGMYIRLSSYVLGCGMYVYTAWAHMYWDVRCTSIRLSPYVLGCMFVCMYVCMWRIPVLGPYTPTLNLTEMYLAPMGRNVPGLPIHQLLNFFVHQWVERCFRSPHQSKCLWPPHTPATQLLRAPMGWDVPGLSIHLWSSTLTF